MAGIIVQELWIYPLKSAQGISREAVRVGATGCEWDRHWMVVRPDGTFLTQRTHSRLARIATELTPEGLVLRREGRAALHLALEAPGPARAVRIWRDTCTGIDLGDAPAAWVGELLAEPVRVVRCPAAPHRLADPRYAGSDPVPLAFPDGYPLLLCNQASLDVLNEKLGAALPMQRFRPNLVLAGLPPFAEDRIETVQIGALRLRLVKPCTRCLIPSLDPRSGERDIDPLPTLRRFRFDPELRGVTFGMNAVISAGSGQTLGRASVCEVTYRS